MFRILSPIHEMFGGFFAKIFETKSLCIKNNAYICHDFERLFRMAIITKIRNWLGLGANNVPNMAGYNDWRVCGGGRAMPTHNYRNVLFFQFVKLIGNLFYDTTLSYSNSSKAF